MRLIIIIIIVFMLVMGSGIVWNFIPALGVGGNSFIFKTTTTPSPPNSTNFTSKSHQGSGPFNSSSNGPVSSSSSVVTLSQQQWLSYAQVAWSFFKPGIGVSPQTGLIYASPYWHEFTDWDLAGYIQAVMAAEKLGLISNTGPWGAEYRLSLVLNFLDNRSLDSNGLWYQFYDSDTGTVSSDALSSPGGAADGGPMLIALYDVLQAYPQFASQVKQAVYRVNYQSLAAQGFGSDVYSQYAKLGFDYWNFTSSSTDASSIAAGSMVVAEPVELAILEHANNSYFNQAGRETYQAQYAAYNRTGQLFALSEGQYPPYLNASTPYVYETIEIPSGQHYQVATWQGQVVNAPPEQFVKIGFAFLAIYKSDYGLLLVNNLGKLTTPDGYSEGLLLPSNQVFGASSDNTNIMIMLACAYGFANS